MSDTIAKDGVEGVEPLRSPGRLYLLEVAADSIGVGDPHAGTEDPCEVEGAEAEAAEAGKQQVDAEDLGQVEGRFTGARVLPDLEIPVSPVPDGG